MPSRHLGTKHHAGPDGIQRVGQFYAAIYFCPVAGAIHHHGPIRYSLDVPSRFVPRYVQIRQVIREIRESLVNSSTELRHGNAA